MRSGLPAADRDRGIGMQGASDLWQDGVDLQ
jgi:hypothetical protein